MREGRREQRVRNKRGNTKVKRGGRAPWQSTHTHPCPKGSEAHEGPVSEQVHSPQRSYIRAGTSQEGLWLADKPMLETVLLL